MRRQLTIKLGVLTLIRSRFRNEAYLYTLIPDRYERAVRGFLE